MTIKRCPWVGSDPRYVRYHDEEWGMPVHDDQILFEFLLLEGAQAGLSWSTILNKRDHYREVFDQFDPRAVAAYDAAKIESLLQDPGIVRNRRKVEAAITNARAFLPCLPRSPAGIWNLRSLHLGLCRWATNSECLDLGRGDTEPVAGIHRHGCGSKETRVQVRRPNDLLRIHADGGDGE